MRGSSLVVLSAASHVSDAQRQGVYSSTLHTSSCRPRAPTLWPIGWSYVRYRPSCTQRAPGLSSTNASSWRSSRKRRKVQEEETGTCQDCESIDRGEASSSHSDNPGVLRPYAVFAKSGVRMLRKLLQLIPDVRKLWRVRQIHHTKQVVWQHGRPIPVRYRPLLLNLRAEIASKRGLERRARRVNHGLDNLALGRFLEVAYWSTEYNGKPVIDFIEESIAWRETVGVHRLRGRDVVKQGARGAILVKGHDRDRRPVVYFRPAVEGKMAGEKSEILMIYTLERAVRLMPRGSWQYTVVIDCEGLGMKNLPSISYMKKIFGILSHHYPMRLGSVLFVNVGPSVMLCWRVVSPLIHQRTKDKMVIIPTSKQAMAFKYIEPSQLLGFAGGQSQWLFEPSAYFSNDGVSQ